MHVQSERHSALTAPVITNSPIYESAQKENQIVKKLLLVTVLLCLVSQFAYADDLNPPPWRGLPGTTFQQWEFDDPNPNPLPTILNNPYGIPSTTVVPNNGLAWFPVFNGRSGVWPLSGYIETTIPNTPIPNPTKTIWVSLTWAPQGIGCTPFVIETTTATSGQLIHQDTVNGWTHSTYGITMYPNPQFESILIQGEVFVDEMVIDTVCVPVPEPGSLAVLGTGAIGLLFGLRRRR
jgi:hypothetical protein